jgi:vacuolar-type H+-ATPase subunit F/Vma7
MGRLVVITTPEVAPGFRLAGVETFAVESGAAAEALLREFLAQGEASLIAVRQELLQALDLRLRRQIETSYRPVVLAIPGGLSTPAGERRHYLAEIIRYAIGFHITFGNEQQEATSP